MLSLRKSSSKQIYGVFCDQGLLISFKNIKNTCRGVLFLGKLQVLHNTPPKVFLTFLNEANCPKSQTKIICIKRKLYALCTLSVAASFEQKTHCVKYVRIRIFSNPYFLIQENMRQRRPVFSHILNHGQHVNQTFR